jgi:hypothetical protein
VRLKPRALLAACLAFPSTTAWALGPPTVVHTKDGSVYYGELVERVVDDHVTIRLATGEVKRFPMNRIDPSPAPSSPLYTPRPSPPPPREVVRTKDGGLLYGEIIERVPKDHVTIKLASGAVKIIAWQFIDTSPPPPAPPVRRALAPVENVRTVVGDVYHGEILERVVRDHVTVRLANGDVKRVPWADLDLSPAPAHKRKPEREVVLDFDPTPATAHLQRHGDDGWLDECDRACTVVAQPESLYRVIGDGLVTTPDFLVRRSVDSHVVANLGSTAASVGSDVLLYTSVPAAIAGIVLLGMAFSSDNNRYAYGPDTGLNVAAAMVNLGVATMFGFGIYLFTKSHSTVTVNGVSITGQGIEF